jgi:hypothetical protein
MPDITGSPLLLGLVATAAYLLGSVPFGLVITRALGLGDLRRIGSGNIGATNVLRTGNRAAAAATLVLDAAKGAVAVLLARAWMGPDAAQVAALFAFLGHLYPVWLGFRGGKGVATAGLASGSCGLRHLGRHLCRPPDFIAGGIGGGRHGTGLGAGPGTWTDACPCDHSGGAGVLAPCCQHRASARGN